MTSSRIPDIAEVASPSQQNLDYYSDLEIADEPLGEGGQTVVYEADIRTAETPKKVAVRQLGDRGFTRSVNQEEFEPFFDRAETWQSLARRERTEPRWRDSDHIVGVVALGDNLPWAALEYMDGESLADRLDGTDGLPIEEAVWITERLCRGLQVAHNTGVAHLDLKPGNILFRETDTGNWDVPKIADWGLARNLLDDTSASMEVLSTRYAAPEQFDREEFGRPGTATDIYQLGAVLYALLTGDPPYTGTERSVLFDIVNKQLPPPPSQRRSEISGELDAVVRTALETRKPDRFDAVTSFRKALEAVRTDGQIPSVITKRLDSKSSKSVAGSADSDEISKTSTSSRGDIDADTRKQGGTSVTQWPMFQHNPARTGSLGDHSGPDAPVATRWQFDTGENVVSSPAVASGTVFFGSNNSHLYAVDAATGNEHWKFETEGQIKSSPAVAHDTVYVGSFDGWLYAIDIESGQARWKHRVDETIWSSPAVAENTVYVGSRRSLGSNGALNAVDATTGEKCWRLETNAAGDSSPTVVDGTVYVGSGGMLDTNGSLHAVDATTGNRHWRFTVGEDTTDGELGPASIWSSPAVTEDTVYVGSGAALDDESSLNAIDISTGDLQWQFETGDGVLSSPAVTANTVYVGSWDGSIYALDTATGTQQWKFDTDGRVQSSPAVADGTVYVGSDDNRLYAVDADTGERHWALNTDEKIQSSPTVVNETVYVGSCDGHVYAVE